jgi:ribonucleotide reductase alpha subunit
MLDLSAATAFSTSTAEAPDTETFFDSLPYRHPNLALAVKNWTDRYALYNAEGERTESRYRETARRVAKVLGTIGGVNLEEEFFEIMNTLRFVPGGRVLGGAGLDHGRATMSNCFSAETLVHLREGVVPIGTLSGVHTVLSDGAWRPATFRSYGEQRLWEVALDNGAVLHATEDHQWVVTKAHGGTERVTTARLAGRRIPVNARPKPERTDDYDEGVRHGIVFGDGAVRAAGMGTVQLFGEKIELAEHFGGYRTQHHPATEAYPEHVRIAGLSKQWKQLPDESQSDSYVHGFVCGLIATDGHVDKRGHVMVHNKSAATLSALSHLLGRAGFVHGEIKMTRRLSPYDGSEKPVYKMTILKSTVEYSDLLRPFHRQHFVSAPVSGAKRTSMAVASVSPTNRIEEVFCCVEPETHTITVGDGYLTGQCFVVPIHDSREGIMRATAEAMEILSKGGGVGINFSPLRHKGAILRTSRGHASGPCSFITAINAFAHTIEQGGSRRAAMMGQLDASHPDILRFIRWKAEHPPLGDTYQVDDDDKVRWAADSWEHLNVSVQVTDDFLHRVKNGESQANQVWEAICVQAWESGDPGLYFIDRANEMNNSGYYQQMICCNPCGEVELPEYGTCNLGSVNLMAHLRRGADGATEVDFDKLEETASLAVTLLDNVLTLNYWPLPETATESARSRRMGVGTMGLADALMECGIPYGSDASLHWIDRVYTCIRDAAYMQSATLAFTRGPFGAYTEEWLQRPFVQRIKRENPALFHVLRDAGSRGSSLLAQAPTGTISGLAGVSSGIEPTFARGWVRTDRVSKDGISVASPWAFDPNLRTANELSAEEHISVQARIQRHTDQGSSKTVNMPKEATVDDVKAAFLAAVESGIKGTTVFRDQCRGDYAVLKPLTYEQLLEQSQGAVCRNGMCDF